MRGGVELGGEARERGALRHKTIAQGIDLGLLENDAVAAGQQRRGAAHHHQTVESRFSISSTGRV